MALKHLGQAALAGVAVSLTGCGQPTTPTPAPTPAMPPPLMTKYIMLAGGGSDNTDMALWLGRVTNCNKQGTNPSDLYTMVDDSCCEASTWTALADPGQVTYELPGANYMSGDMNTTYTCPVMELDFLGWVRGYSNCEGGQQTWAESCVPEDINTSAGEWPMSASVAATKWELGTYESCHCEEQKIVSDGCWVGKTFPTMAFFFKIDSTQCTMMSEMVV